VTKLRWEKERKRATTSLERAQAQQDRFKRVALHAHGGDCPKCGCATVRRVRKSDDVVFYGCARYPRCNGVWKPKPMPP